MGPPLASTLGSAAMIRESVILAALAVLSAPALASARPNVASPVEGQTPAPPFSISPGQIHTKASRIVAEQSAKQVVQSGARGTRAG